MTKALREENQSKIIFKSMKKIMMLFLMIIKTLNSIKCIAKHFQKNEYGKIVTTSSIPQIMV